MLPRESLRGVDLFACILMLLMLALPAGAHTVNESVAPLLRSYRPQPELGRVHESQYDESDQSTTATDRGTIYHWIALANRSHGLLGLRRLVLGW